MRATPQRSVKLARIRCREATHALRARSLLEDALRTASMGDEGRLIVIRRIDLGPLRLTDGATHWSLCLEQRVRALATGAVRFTTPNAEAAQAVWFPDELTPYLELAARVSRAQRVDQWYWQAAVKDWHPGRGQTEALRWLFRAIAAEGLHATALLARRLDVAGRLDGLLEVLSEQDLLPLSRFDMARFSSTEPSHGSGGIEDASGLSSRADWRRRLQRFVPGWGVDSLRARWLAVISPRAHKLVWPEEKTLFQQAAGILEDTRTDFQEPPPASREQESGSALPDVGASHSQIRRGPDAVESGSETEPQIESPQNPEPTAAGGLLFCLALFRQLGWPDDFGEVALNGAAYLGLVALDRIADACHVPSDDPIREALSLNSIVPARIKGSSPLGSPAFFAPTLATKAARSHGGTSLLRMSGTDWQVLVDGSGRLPVAVWQGAAPDPVRAWLADRGWVTRRETWTDRFPPMAAALALGAHRLCRRLTGRACLEAGGSPGKSVPARRPGMGLRSLINRPACVSWTGTHIDLFFEPSRADGRIRRAGLDIDPGWVSWLGRIVNFHFVDALESGRARSSRT